jgi:hypothetical protein
MPPSIPATFLRVTVALNQPIIGEFLLFALGFAAVGMLRGDAGLRSQQFGNTDQVVGDQIDSRASPSPLDEILPNSALGRRPA